METGKPGLASVPVHIGSVAAQTEKRMPIQAPLTAVYIHTVPALPVQPYIQPPATAREPSTFHLSMPPLYSKETLPFVALHLAGGLQPQLRPSLAAVAPTAKPKSAGKHVCPHCGRDCMKPSVLEKHLRCHTGERPYPCTTCGVSFKTQSNLYKHRRTQAHARLSSESEQSSMDSMSSSRETCTSSLSLDEHSEELGSIEKNDMLPAAESSSPASPTKSLPVETRGSVSEQRELSLPGHDTETKSTDETKEDDKQKTDSSKRPLTVSRHLPLQRQEATLFSKQWGSSVSKGKSQSHESTDSGFSESSDHYPSPSSILPDHSMISLIESNEKLLEETPSTHTSPVKDHSEEEPQHTAKKQEQKMLAERISKLISENTAVVEDKNLENVRPRKTVLSKQGSIDLPMPYTFKDSFHFDMRINPTQNTGLKKYNKPGLPPQCTSTMKHAPLTRSNSLPFSFTLMQPERSSSTSPYQGDYVTILRRGSSGQINPTDLARKPVNQHSSTHRPLVRQTAVDCNHATDGLFTNSSVEEACTSSLSCDGDVGDICGEPNVRKFRRKKAQKFAYNKWYMYGNGTFKKLYNPNKNADNCSFKGRKCPTNTQPEALPNRGPEVQKEAVTTSNSTINCKNSDATAGRPGASLSLVSSVDSTLQRYHLNSTNSSINAPLRRNLSLSLLPLLATGSMVSHKTESLNRTEAGRCIDVSQHTDSSWQLCGAHVPSDRKKQRTEDKTASYTEMETDPNTPTHPPAVVSSVPQNDTNQKQKGAILLPYILSANVPPISTSAASSISVAANSTFLPKYQLKLPNTRDADFNASPQAQSKSKEKVSPEASWAPSDQSLLSATAYGENCENPKSSLLVQTAESSKMKTLTSTPEQLVLPGIVTSLCESKLLLHGHSSTSSLEVVQRQIATTTKTTSCLQDYSGGLCSTLLQSLKSATDSMPTRLPQPLAPAAVNVSLTTAGNQMLASTVTAVSPNIPLAHTQLSTASDSANPPNKAHISLKTPVAACPTVPLDQPTQNVFHVHTADLQICLQIISDEQLALIAPQIERASGTSRPQMCDIEEKAPEIFQNETQNSSTREVNDARGHHEQPESQKTNGRGTFHTPNMERITSSVSEQFVRKEQAHNLPDHSGTWRASASAVCLQGSSQQPHKSSHGSMIAQTPSCAGSLMSTAASLRVVTTGGIQTLENEQAFCLNCATDDRRVSQSGAVSQRFSDQCKLSTSSSSTSTENQKGMKNDLPGKSHGDLSAVGSLKTSGDILADGDSWTESGEGLRYTSGGDHQSVAPASTGKSKSPSPLQLQTSVYCSPEEEPTLSRSQGSSKVRHSSSSPPSLEEPSHDGTSSDQSDIHLGLLTSQSSYILKKRAEDPPAVWTGLQNPPAGTSLVQRLAQKEQQRQEPAGTSAQPESTDWRPKQSDVEAETNHPTSEEQGAAGVTGEDKNQGIKTDKMSESYCRCEVPPDGTKLQEEGTKVEVDSFKRSCLSEQHLQLFFQTQPGMSECPPPAPQQDQSTSHSPALPASNIPVSLLSSAVEIKQLHPPLKTWESSSTHDQPMQVFHESVSSGHAQVQLSETQNSFSIPESNFHSVLHHSKNQMYNGMAAQQGHTSAGNYGTAVNSSDFMPSESSKNTHFSPDLRTQPSMQFTHISQESLTAAGLTENNQNTGPPSNPFTYLDFDEKQNSIRSTPYEQTSQSSNSGRPDVNNKYQSMFLVESFHGYQAADCLSSAVRPVPIYQDYPEDTSSSDDEGKLIIEL